MSRTIKKRITLSLCGLIFWGDHVAAQAVPTPNIVLILSDDQSYTDYSFMGHPHNGSILM